MVVDVPTHARTAMQFKVYGHQCLEVESCVFGERA